MAYEEKLFIANKIKQLRKKAGLTQEKLAELIGIGAKQLSRIENGDYIPSLPTFLRLVQELKIDLIEFGIQFEPTKNIAMARFIKLVSQASDYELDFCYSIVKKIIEQLRCK